MHSNRSFSSIRFIRVVIVLFVLTCSSALRAQLHTFVLSSCFFSRDSPNVSCSPFTRISNLCALRLSRTQRIYVVLHGVSKLSTECVASAISWLLPAYLNSRVRRVSLFVYGDDFFFFLFFSLSFFLLKVSSRRTSARSWRYTICFATRVFPREVLFPSVHGESAVL